MTIGSGTGDVTGAETSRFADAHARLLADDSIQFALPAFAPPPMPAWLKPLAHMLRVLGPYLTYIFWGIVILGAAVILFLIVQEMTGIAWRWPWRRAEHGEDENDSWRPDAHKARTSLDQADMLAGQGDYDAAVQLLLRRSVEDISERLPDFLRPSLTARDIAGARMIPGRARDAFARIARVVEAALFARRPVGVEGWHAARDAYEQFAFRGAWT